MTERSNDQNGAVVVYKKVSDIYQLMQPYSIGENTVWVPGGWTTDGVNRASEHGGVWEDF